MANFDSSKWNSKSDVSPNIGALPYIEIDQSTLTYGPTQFQGYGTVSSDGQLHRVQFIYYGSFDYSNQSRYLNSIITGANLSSPTLGSALISGLEIKVSDFLSDPNSVGRALLAGDDEIIGSAFGETIEPYLGFDVVRAGAGNDRLVGGYGVDGMYGEAGSDTFVIRQNAGPSWIARHKLPSYGIELDTKKLRKGGRKQWQSYFDANYISCPDFSLSEDAVSYEGIAASSVEVGEVAGYQGIHFFQAGTDNILAYFPNITMAAYDAAGGMFEI
jgi:Ca2+-binding RTX toxin-like protein